MRKVDVDKLADHAVYLLQKRGLTMPNAVWSAMRIQNLGERSDAPELAKQVLINLQKRSVARRMKNKKRGLVSERISGQLDFKTFRSESHQDMIAVRVERGGDPDD